MSCDARQGTVIHSVTTGGLATVKRVDAQNQYRILVDDQPVGIVAYADRDDQRVFLHTEIDDAFAGQGLAARLVQHALTDTRTSGKRIAPVCPYVAKYLKRHDDFTDITDPVTPDLLQWLDTTLS